MIIPELDSCSGHVTDEDQDSDRECEDLCDYIQNSSFLNSSDQRTANKNEDFNGTTSEHPLLFNNRDFPLFSGITHAPGPIAHEETKG